MANNAQNSQNKSDNLGRGRVAYAFKVNRVNPDFVSFKVWILGYYTRVCSIAVVSLPKIVAQIDTALAEGECEFEIGGIRFSADEKLLKSIREELSSYCYCCEGASDANHVPSADKTALPQSESLRSTKPKASAPQGSASAARYLSTPLCAMGDADYVAPSASQVRSACGAGVTADVSAIRADVAEMRESQEDFFENLAALLLRIAEVLNDGGDAKPKQPRGWQKCAVENPLGGVIRTKRGRTSVVVGVRKISTPKKQK